MTVSSRPGRQSRKGDPDLAAEWAAAPAAPVAPRCLPSVAPGCPKKSSAATRASRQWSERAGGVGKEIVVWAGAGTAQTHPGGASPFTGSD